MRIISVIMGVLFLFISIVKANETNETGEVEKGSSEKEKIVELEGKINGMEESFLETKSTVEKLNKLKISGYIQAQFQYADTEGVATSMCGRKFDKGTRSTFYVRRGRIKFDYKDGLSRYVFQFDGSSSGFEIKDAYVEYTEPFLKYFTGTIGIFDRPFGYEISYSSSMRESPERSRIYQTLFPKEREIGAKISFAAESGILSYFNFKGGVFNGITPLQLENNFYKDFIGRIGFELPFKELDMAIDGGFSFYYGKIENTDTTAGTKTISKIDSSWIVKSTLNDTGGIVHKAVRKYDTTYSFSDRGITYEMDGNKFKKIIGCKDKVYDRNYLGVDLQFYKEIPVIGGMTIRGEYLWGIQPGTAGSSSFYQPSAGRAPNGAVYLRNFAGYYVYYVQCWGSKIQSVVKYDYYDPNIKVSGNDIGASGSYTTATDLAWKTLGVGIIYHIDGNLKVMAYLDMPKNEISTALKNSDPYKDFSRDMPDNVMTIRFQYRF